MSGSGLWRVVSLTALMFAMALPAPAANAGFCPIGGHAAVSCPAMTDSVIAGVVGSRLGGVARGTDVIQVRVADGVIYLSGHVGSQFQRDSAGILASTVRGATFVCNNIIVRPPLMSDVTILAEVNRALRRSTYNVNMVRAMVENGIVTLTGFVSDEETRSMIVLIPHSVPGVTAVINQLTVRQRWQN